MEQPATEKYIINKHNLQLHRKTMEQPNCDMMQKNTAMKYKLQLHCKTAKHTNRDHSYQAAASDTYYIFLTMQR